MTAAQCYTVDVQHDADTDDYYIQFTDEMLAQLGWQVGDVLEWKDLGDQKWQLTRSTSAKTPT